MAWNAKPSGAYGISSDEAIANYKEVVNLLSDTWTMEAICGMLGNMYAESGMNPWRWQSDSVSLTSSSKGYGLVQFTPAYGYINNYGVGVDYYAPNLSTTSVTTGAAATDGRAQIYVIDNDLAGKFINRSSWCSFLDISGYYPMSNFRQADSLYGATVAWLFHYEAPSDHSESVANARYSYASQIYELLTGYEPEEPDSTGGTYDYTDEDIEEDDSDSGIIKITPFYTEVGAGNIATFYVRILNDWESSLHDVLEAEGEEDFSVVGFEITYTLTVEVTGWLAGTFDVTVEANDRKGYVEIQTTKSGKSNGIYKVVATLTQGDCNVYVQYHDDEYEDGDYDEVSIDLAGQYSTAYFKLLKDKKEKGKSVLFYRRPNHRIIS